MALNTFHYAGVSVKSNVTRGIPRLDFDDGFDMSGPGDSESESSEEDIDVDEI